MAQYGPKKLQSVKYVGVFYDLIIIIYCMFLRVELVENTSRHIKYKFLVIKMIIFSIVIFSISKVWDNFLSVKNKKIMT